MNRSFTSFVNTYFCRLIALTFCHCYCHGRNYLLIQRYYLLFLQKKSFLNLLYQYKIWSLNFYNLLFIFAALLLSLISKIFFFYYYNNIDSSDSILTL